MGTQGRSQDFSRTTRTEVRKSFFCLIIIAVIFTAVRPSKSKLTRNRIPSMNAGCGIASAASVDIHSKKKFILINTLLIPVNCCQQSTTGNLSPVNFDFDGRVAVKMTAVRQDKSRL